MKHYSTELWLQNEISTVKNIRSCGWFIQTDTEILRAIFEDTVIAVLRAEGEIKKKCHVEYDMQITGKPRRQSEKQ